MNSTEKPPTITTVHVDVAVLKEQIVMLTRLCGKMDIVIEKLVEQHDRHLEKVYTDMADQKNAIAQEIKEAHVRVDTVLDKLAGSEKTLLDEIKGIREELQDHYEQEQESFDKINRWKWMIAGGIVVVSWFFSTFHGHLPTIG